MKKQRNEIDEIVHQGKTEDSIKILNEEAVDHLLIFLDKNNTLSLAGSVNYFESLGMLNMAFSVLENAAFEDDKA